MDITIQAYYTQCNTTTVNLPEGKTWNSVADYYVKYGVLFIKWRGEDDWQEFALSDDFSESDMKFPDSLTIYDENGDIVDED